MPPPPPPPPRRPTPPAPPSTPAAPQKTPQPAHADPYELKPIQQPAQRPQSSQPAKPSKPSKPASEPAAAQPNAEDPLAALASFGAAAPSRNIGSTAAKPSSVQPRTKNEKKKSPILLFSIIGGVLVVGIVVVAIIFSSGGPENKPANSGGGGSGASAGGSGKNAPGDPLGMLDIASYMPESSDGDALKVEVYNLRNFNGTDVFINLRKDLQPTLFFYSDPALKPEDLHDIILISGGASKSATVPNYRIYHTTRDLDIAADIKDTKLVGKMAGFDVYDRTVSIPEYTSHDFIAKVAPNTLISMNMSASAPQFEAYLERVKSGKSIPIPARLQKSLDHAGGSGDYYAAEFSKGMPASQPQYSAIVVNITRGSIGSNRAFEFNTPEAAANFLKQIEAEAPNVKKTVPSFEIAQNGAYVNITATIKAAEIQSARESAGNLLPF